MLVISVLQCLCQNRLEMTSRTQEGILSPHGLLSVLRDFAAMWSVLYFSNPVGGGDSYFLWQLEN